MSTSLWPRTATRARRAPPDHYRRARCRLRLEPLEDRCTPAANVVIEWNQVLLDTFKAGLVPAGPAATRDAAIVHAAIYDAVNAIDRSYTPLFADVQAPRGASLDAAAAQAAHDTLVALFPAHQATYDATLAADLADIPPGRARLGAAVGQAVAQQILAWRSTDGSSAQVPYTPGSGPGVWQPTPPAFAPAIAPQWGHVTPFAIPSDSAFRPPPPPALTSAEYTAAFNEVKSLGAAGSTTRTADQSQIAQFWYGAAPTGSVTPAGYWNQIAQDIAQRQGDSLVQDARLFALLNVAQADALFAVFDAKYTYNFWRPVTAIRAADTDGNPATAPDPTWSSFLVTPAHPSYISAHSGVSSASAAVLAAFFGSDAIPFTFSSDSLPGVTRSFASFSAAAQEASDSRVYAGIHWRFDVQAGQTLGSAVGDYVFTHILLPRDHPSALESADRGPGGPGAGLALDLSPPAPRSPAAAVPAVGAAVTPGPAPARATFAPDAMVGGRPSTSGPILQPDAQKGVPGEAAAGAFVEIADGPWADALTDDWA
jgi:membrane-associated phospholipid phosphatase